MRRFICFLVAALALFACSPEDINPQEDESQITVTGLPGSRVKPYSIFTLSASSPSSGYIAYESSNPEIAEIHLSARRQYQVTTTAPLVATPVTIRFTQEATDAYPEATAEVNFTVVTESESIDPTTPDDSHKDLDGIKVTFTESTAQLLNPERGLYHSRNFYNNYAPIAASEVKAQRIAGYTVWYFGFYLTDFMGGDISQSYLEMVRNSLAAVREGGAKCKVRFAYKDYMNDGEDMDPAVDVVLRHVDQLKPVLQDYEDVILVLQAGFVGPWGEWHSSTHFGSGFDLRRKLMDALLDAVPQSRQIQVRTPQFKMRMYNWKIADTLTAATAHDGSAKSRIAGHNDCFGASVNDYGTFDNEKNDRQYWKTETRYTLMSGETCNVSEYCSCANTAKDMKDYHWTCLNKDYNSDVLNKWKSGSCYNDFIARLGYRLVLQDLFYSKKFSKGKECSVTIRFYNTGFAAPMNPRDAILVWVPQSGNPVETSLGSDPRTWQPGYHSVSASFIPNSDKGALYLKLSDPLLRNRPEYSIAFANENVFDSQTGMNKLFEIK